MSAQGNALGRITLSVGSGRRSSLILGLGLWPVRFDFERQPGTLPQADIVLGPWPALVIEILGVHFAELVRFPTGGLTNYLASASNLATVTAGTE